MLLNKDLVVTGFRRNSNGMPYEIESSGKVEKFDTLVGVNDVILEGLPLASAIKKLKAAAHGSRVLHFLPHNGRESIRKLSTNSTNSSNGAPQNNNAYRGNVAVQVNLTEYGRLTRNFSGILAMFGMNSSSCLPRRIVMADPPDACTALTNEREIRGSSGETIDNEESGDVADNLNLADDSDAKLHLSRFMPSSMRAISSPAAYVLVQRGSCDFLAKAHNVMHAGGTGMIVINSAGQSLVSMPFDRSIVREEHSKEQSDEGQIGVSVASSGQPLYADTPASISKAVSGAVAAAAGAIFPPGVAGITIPCVMIPAAAGVTLVNAITKLARDRVDRFRLVLSVAGRCHNVDEVVKAAVQAQQLALTDTQERTRRAQGVSSGVLELKWKHTHTHASATAPTTDPSSNSSNGNGGEAVASRFDFLVAGVDFYRALARDAADGKRNEDESEEGSAAGQTMIPPPLPIDDQALIIDFANPLTGCSAATVPPHQHARHAATSAYAAATQPLVAWVVERGGGCSWRHKMRHAVERGAALMIVMNNEPGLFRLGAQSDAPTAAMREDDLRAEEQAEVQRQRMLILMQSNGAQSTYATADSHHTHAYARKVLPTITVTWDAARHLRGGVHGRDAIGDVSARHLPTAVLRPKAILEHHWNDLNQLLDVSKWPRDAALRRRIYSKLFKTHRPAGWGKHATQVQDRTTTSERFACLLHAFKRVSDFHGDKAGDGNGVAAYIGVIAETLNMTTSAATKSVHQILQS